MRPFAEIESMAERISFARQDLRDRTLNKITIPVERLVYLASLRDYSTGRYYHDGLAMLFSQEVAGEALRREHMETFNELARTPLQILVEQLNYYLNSLNQDHTESLRTWESLEPYRVVAPVGADELTVRIFLSNVRIAVAILVLQQRTPPIPIGLA
ncbi:MAG: hypothetical protein JSS69_18100 [Acidobacteria bacterium]|nr:hypothetical protein [Acidobacteriota bacterium]